MEENLSTRLLLTELSVDEKVQRGEEAGNLDAEIEGLKEQLKAASGGIKAKITDANKRARRLFHILATGKEEREVTVRTDKDWEHKEVVIIRTDTGAVVEKRTMTASEAQADLLDRGAEPGKLLALDGGKAADGAPAQDAQQPELSEDEKVWADAIDGTGRHTEEEDEADGETNVEETETGPTADETPEPEAAPEADTPKRGRKRKG